MITSSNYSADTFVTAANPAPGRSITMEYPVRSGTGWGVGYTQRLDGGIGQNVYIAGGIGPNGEVLVSGNIGINLSGVSISAAFGGDVNITASIPLEVTASEADPVWITGSVYVLNTGSGSSFPTGTLTATITGVVVVSQSNIPATQSVDIVSSVALQVSGNVGVVGTASVVVVSLPQPLQVTGTVAVSGITTITGTVTLESTGVYVQNLPTTQSVYVVNQTSGSVSVSGTASVYVTNFPTPITTVTATLTGVVAVSQTNVAVTQTVFISNILSGTVTVSGTASITGNVHVDNPITGVFILGTASFSQTNNVLTQTVQISGVTPVNGFLPVSGNFNVSLSGVSISAAFGGQVEITASIPLVVTSSKTSPVWVTGTFSGGATSVVFIPPVANPSTASFNSIPQDIALTLLLVASPDRVGYQIFNSSSSPLLIYVAPFTGVGEHSIQLASMQVYETADLVYTGDVYGTWVISGTGFAQVTEYTEIVSGSSGSFTLNVGNLPATQSVYVVNQQSASLSGVNVVSGALQVTGTITVAGISFSGSFSGASDININGTTVSNNYSISFPTASMTLLAANNARKNFTIFNDSDQNLLVRLGAAASLTSWTFNLYPQHFYEPSAQVWKGIVTCVGAAAGSGALQVEEMFL